MGLLASRKQKGSRIEKRKGKRKRKIKKEKRKGRSREKGEGERKRERGEWKGGRNETKSAPSLQHPCNACSLTRGRLRIRRWAWSLQSWQVWMWLKLEHHSFNRLYFPRKRSETLPEQTNVSKKKHLNLPNKSTRDNNSNSRAPYSFIGDAHALPGRLPSPPVRQPAAPAAACIRHGHLALLGGRRLLHLHGRRGLLQARLLGRRPRGEVEERGLEGSGKGKKKL